MNDAKGRKVNDINDESVAHFVQRKKNEREENFRFWLIILGDEINIASSYNF